MHIDKFFHNSLGAERYRGTPHFIGKRNTKCGICLSIDTALLFFFYIYCSLTARTSSFKDSILASRSETILAHSTSSFLIFSGAFPSNL